MKQITVYDLKQLNEIISEESENGKTWFTPYAIHGPKIDQWICRQSGNFIAFGTLIWPIEYYEDEKLKNELSFDFETDLKCITKIILSSKLSGKIGAILRKNGIDEKYIYNGYNIKDDISKQAEISNKEVISKKLKEWENEYIEFEKNSPALYLTSKFMDYISNEKTSES